MIIKTKFPQWKKLLNLVFSMHEADPNPGCLTSDVSRSETPGEYTLTTTFNCDLTPKLFTGEIEMFEGYNMLEKVKNKTVSYSQN